MDFYSNKQPNLIGPVMKSTICTIVQKPTINNTVSDKITSYVGDLYKDYIIDNKFMVCFLILVVGFLIYRYYNKTPVKKPLEGFNLTDSECNKDKNLLKEIEEYQINKMRYDNPPAMNPLNSIADDNDLIYYPPDPLPINIPGDGMVYARDIYDNQPKANPINHVKYDYNNVYKNPSRQYYTGSYNTYQNAKDTDIINPYGWSNNFNTNAGKFVGPMTDKNNQVLVDYQSTLDNTNNNLTGALNYGSNKSEYAFAGIDPPYALDD